MFFSRLLSALADAFLGANPLVVVVVGLFSVWGVVLGVVEFLAEKRPKIRLYKATAYTAIVLGACFLVWTPLVLLFLAGVCLLMLYGNRKRSQKRNCKVEAKLCMGQEHLPVEQEPAVSVEFQQAQTCLEGNRPQEAVEHLRRCRGKITVQIRYWLLYADALILLGNYAGARDKLNDVPDRQMRGKENFKKVMLRKAGCFRALHEYENELVCYDALLARDIDPKTLYLWRAQVKQRMLEVYNCLPSVENAVGKTERARKVFLQGILADLDQSERFLRKNDALTAGKLLSHRGACQVLDGEFSQGQTLLEKAQKQNEFYANTYIYEGISLARSDSPDKAVETLHRAVQYAEQNEKRPEEERDRIFIDTAFYELAKLFFSRGHYDAAIRYAAQALSLFPRRSDCFELQGDCYQTKMMYTEAIACYTQALNLKPTASRYYRRGACFFNRSNQDCALAYRDTQQAIQLNPDKKIYRLSALLYRSTMDRRECKGIDKAELEEQVALFSDDQEVLGNLGTIYKNYGYWEESEACYREAILRGLDTRIDHYNLAALLYEQGRYEEAAEELNKTIQYNATSQAMYELLIECYRQMGDTENEIAVRGRLNRLLAKYAMVNRVNGDAVFTLGGYKKAEEYYRAALQYSANAPVLNNLACICYMQGQYEQAAEHLAQAVREDKNYAPAYFNLGNCQLRMSRNGREELIAKAEENYKTALRLDPKQTRAAQMLDGMREQEIRMLPDLSSVEKKKPEKLPYVYTIPAPQVPAKA